MESATEPVEKEEKPLPPHHIVDYIFSTVNNKPTVSFFLRNGEVLRFDEPPQNLNAHTSWTMSPEQGRMRSNADGTEEFISIADLSNAIARQPKVHAQLAVNHWFI